MRYDREVRAAVARWAPFFGVPADTALVHAVIEQETLHGTAANYVRNGGIVPEPGGRYSVGPMQVLNTTAPELGYPDARVLVDPAKGISAGTRYLFGLVKHYQGDVVRAVSAYNAGKGGVGSNPGYVSKVIGFYELYRKAAPGAVGVVALALLALIARGRRRRRVA